MRSVTTKFLILFAPVFLLVTMAALHMVAERHVTQARAQLSARLGTQLGRVSGLLTPQLVQEEKGLGARVVSTLLADQAVTCVDVVLGGENDPRLAQPRNLGCKVMQPERTVTTSLPNVDGGEIVLGFSEGEITALRAESRNLAIMIALGGGFAALIIGIFAFRFSVGRPVAQLAAVMRNTRYGEYRHVEVTTRDEIGTLSMVYNELVDRLADGAEEVRRAQEDLSNAYHSTPALLFTMDADGTIRSTSQFWSEATGYDADAIVGRSLWDLAECEPDAPSSRDIASALAAGKAVKDVPLHFHTADSEVIDVLLSIVPDQRRTESGNGFVCVMNDVTLLRLTESNLRQLAVTDQLTGLPNRRAMTDCVSRLGLKGRTDDPRWAVLFIDLDDFKTANDTFGHAAGDRLLLTIANRITAVTGNRGMAARLGGDEFAVVMPDIADVSEAETLAEELITAINEPVDLRVGTGYVGASIGITSERLSKLEPTDALSLSDHAMYLAKSAGKNRYVVHDGQDADGLKQRAEIVHVLRTGIDQGCFAIHFQPIIDLGTMKPHSVEALLRVNKADGTPLPVETVIAMAEETGQMATLGQWIFDEAVDRFRDLGLASGNRDISLSINLSPKQLGERFVSHVEARIAAEPELAHRLVLEVTETATMGRFDRAVAMLKRLQALGIRIALDDFGTGYSSFAYISRLPLDILKLDRGFMLGHKDELMNAQSRMALIRSIATLAKELGLVLVAEGLETHERVEEVHSLGVNLGQGYAFARPMNLKDSSDWLAAFSRRSRTHERALSRAAG